MPLQRQQQVTDDMAGKANSGDEQHAIDAARGGFHHLMESMRDSVPPALQF